MMNRRKLSKIIIIGDLGVGKTTLLHLYVDKTFTQSYKCTIGADFIEKQVRVDAKVIILQIFDTFRQQKFRSLGGAFYRGADCCVLVYDITNKKSFDNIESWIQEFLNQGAPKEPQKFPFILVGNKIDREQERQVQQEQVNQFLAKHLRIKHLKTSAKNSDGVSAAFEAIALASVQNKPQQTQINSLKLQPSKPNSDQANKKNICY